MDSDVYLQLIGKIYEASVDASRWSGCLTAIADVTNARGICLLYNDFHGYSGGGIAAAVNLDPEAQRRYGSHYGALDPWMLHGVPRGLFKPGEVNIGERIIAHRDLRKTEYYSDFASHFGITRVLAGTIRQDGPLAASISALRRDSDAPFDERDQRLLRSLMSHLQRALQIHRRIGGIDVTWQAITDALDHIATGIILVHQDTNVLFANGVAREILKNCDGLTSTGQGLVAAVPEENRQLRLLVQGAAWASAGMGEESGGALRVSRPSLRRPLSVLVTPMRLPLGTPFDDQRALAAIFVTDPERALSTNLCTLRALWGLTPAEGKIATHIACGCSLREISELQSMEVSTVRWHLKHILAKTEARTQAELVRLFSRGPLS